MPLHADKEPPEEAGRTGRYCSICDELWHEPYYHKRGPFWHAPASGGAYYLVYGTACGCKGHHFRGRCKHLERVAELEAQGRTNSLSHNSWLRYEMARWP